MSVNPWLWPSEAETRARADVDPDVLDLAHLGRYTAGDRALERELLGLFRPQLSLQLAALRASDEQASWNMAAHTLKGAARSLGAHNIARIAERLEEAGRHGEVESLPMLYEELSEAVSRCEGAIDSVLRAS